MKTRSGVPRRISGHDQTPPSLARLSIGGFSLGPTPGSLAITFGSV
jgi:hypothetical protein